jgi:hypothetical protein
MLSPEEKRFVERWSVERTKKKNWLRRYTIGLPLGVGLIVLISINLLTGWHKPAAMAIKNNTSVLLVIIIAAIGIVVFVTWFGYNHQWDQKEEQYQHLLKKTKDSSAAGVEENPSIQS